MEQALRGAGGDGGEDSVLVVVFGGAGDDVLNGDDDFIALSFVRSDSDAADVRLVMDEEGITVPVIAKIEKPQAVEALEEIIDAFDAIMVARGDLGVELPLEQVPLVQKRAVELSRRWAKPVIRAC